jgi:hypothetical protein
MPFLDYKLSFLDCQVFRFGKLPGLQSDRLSEHHVPFQFKDSLAITASHVDMDWGMVIAVEKEPKSVLGENCGHSICFFAPSC